MAKLLALCALCVIFATAALASPQDLEDEPRYSDVIDEIQGDEPREADLDLSSEDEDDEEDKLLDRDVGEEVGDDDEEVQVEPSDRWGKPQYVRRLRCCPNLSGYRIRRTRWGRLRCYVRRSYRSFLTSGRCGGSKTTAKATATMNLGGTRYTVTLQKDSRSNRCSGMSGWRRRFCLQGRTVLFPRQRGWGYFGRR